MPMPIWGETAICEILLDDIEEIDAVCPLQGL
jgi:hypothetical protein